jgi:sulfate transport system substrate-binding protein
MTSNNLWGWLRRWLIGLLLWLGVSGAITSCSAPGNTVELTLVSFAVTRNAYETILPQFEDYWLQTHGQRVSFSRSYGPSGSQTRAVMDGLEADVVALALALDVNKIQASGLIAPDWQERAPAGAIAYHSIPVLVTRPGNPREITDWPDLARDNVQVVTANPKTSGGARWNFLGLWGSVTEAGGSEAEAMEFAEQVFANAPVLPRESREATDAFNKQGQGDVLINYENEVLLARQMGQALSYEIPAINISIDCPVTVVDAYVDKHGTREVAEAFVQYLFTPAAQRQFARAGFRPVNPETMAEFADTYPPVNQLFTIEDLGGWTQAQEKFFADGGIFDQIQFE